MYKWKDVENLADTQLEHRPVGQGGILTYIGLIASMLLGVNAALEHCSTWTEVGQPAHMGELLNIMAAGVIAWLSPSPVRRKR